MSHDAPGDRTGPGAPRAYPVLAVSTTFGAALAFAGVGTVTSNLGSDGIGLAAGAIVALLAGVMALVPATRPGALLLVWNALGIGGAMFVIGIFSVGALVAFPLVLLGITLASWPRRDGESIASVPAIAVLVTGFLLGLALYGVDETVVTNVRRLAGS